ncbi:MAG: thioredoxin domain-containing protein [Myxococcota bacterium]
MNKGSAIISILIALVGGILIGNLTASSGGGDEISEESSRGGEGADEALELGAAPTNDVARVRVAVDDNRPWKGTRDALVTIVEISDFECPFCGRVNPTISRILDEYEGKVKVVWRNNPLPFHQNAPLAHRAAMEVFEQGGSEKFWAFHDIIFQNQRAIQRADLEGYAERVGGIDMGQFRAALDGTEHQDAITEDQAIATRIDARGTPHFVINGRKIAGAQPFEAFKTIIDEEIATGEAIVEAGTSARAVYATLMQNATDNAAPAAAAGAQAAQKQPQQAQRQPDPNAVYKVPVGNEPQKGPDNALVTIVEVSDFECPFCGRVNPTIAQIIERYGNDVRVVWFNNPLPFHQNAPLAHRAALEVFEQGGDAKFWAFHDKLFENQRAIQRADLERYAEELGGINMGQFRAALDGDEHQETITAHQNLARSLGASGTPSFFINGRNLRGAQPLQAFTAVIDEELAKARALVESGTNRNNVYAKTIEDGHESQQFVGGAAPAPAAAPPAPDTVYEIAVPRDAPSKGSANARVVIQEFSDFECPFCGRVNPTIAQIMEEYGDRVRIVWRHYPLPFHQNAPLAHQASLEVHRQGGDEKFWAYHDILFQNQRALQRADLERYAEQVGGINMAQFRSALDTNRHQARMQQDIDAISEAGARIGTPSFFINGRLIQGAQPFPQFKAAIDAALEG